MEQVKSIYINGEPVDVTEEVYYTYHKMRRQERTLTEKDARNRVVHYDAWSDGFLGGGEPLAGAPALTPEEIVIMRQTRSKLHNCLALLTEEERGLIHALFYEGKTASALAEQTGIPRRTLGCRCDRILKKLRKMMDA